jgi:putative hydrolase of the HAD superfamily
MLPERRALVFDMDDTLYPHRRFLLSGFAAVAAYLERGCRVNRRAAFWTLARASRGEARGREIQACLAAFDLSPAIIPALVSVMRHHQPSLTLPRTVADMLRACRRNGWRLGVLTNGPRAIQARKAAALGVARYVDTIVYATEHGRGMGKPDPACFAEVIRRLGVPARDAVFVGDDEICDIAGAASAGLSTVHCAVWRPLGASTAADAVVDRPSKLPAVAERVLLEARIRHAA